MNGPIRLHTAVSDAIDAACTHDGEIDYEQRAEMRAESDEYRREVMGHFDEPYDPYDDEGDGYGPDCDGPDGSEWDDEERDGADGDDGREDMGWDGGMED